MPYMLPKQPEALMAFTGCFNFDYNTLAGIILISQPNTSTKDELNTKMNLSDIKTTKTART